MGSRYLIERRGGLAGMKGSGVVDADTLSFDDRRILEQLLDGEDSPCSDPGNDRYTYLVTREAASGGATREIPESLLPDAVAQAVRTTI